MISGRSTVNKEIIFMKLFEYQAKQLFSEAGIVVPKGHIVSSLDEVEALKDESIMPCVLKSQVLQGGRGKAGLIQFASSYNEMYEKASELFNSKANVKKILIETRLGVKEELYLAMTIEPVTGRILIMASRAGGMDIEETAKTAPEKIVYERVDINRGLLPFQCRNVMFGLGLSGDNFKQGVKILTGLFELFKKYDAELVEINPLVITDSGLVAADGKFSIDDNASTRQKRFEKTPDYYDNQIEYEASLEGIPFLYFGGDIGLMCAGAGLTNTVYDLINDYGGTVANYLEFGGPNYKKALQAMQLTLKAKPKVILIVTFGTIARADVMAEGIADAISKLKPQIPIITAIRGTNEEQAAKILSQCGLEPLFDTEDAVKQAVAIAKGGR